jgi:hypothetical protein
MLSRKSQRTSSSLLPAKAGSPPASCQYYWLRPLGAPEDHRRLVVEELQSHKQGEKKIAVWNTPYWGVPLRTITYLTEALRRETREVFLVELVIATATKAHSKHVSRGSDGEKSNEINAFDPSFLSHESIQDWQRLVEAVHKLRPRTLVLRPTKSDLLSDRHMQLLWKELGGSLRRVQIIYPTRSAFSPLLDGKVMKQTFSYASLFLQCRRLQSLSLHHVTLTESDLESLGIMIHNHPHHGESLQELSLRQCTFATSHVSFLTWWHGLCHHTRLEIVEIDPMPCFDPPAVMKASNADPVVSPSSHTNSESNSSQVRMLEALHFGTNLNHWKRVWMDDYRHHHRCLVSLQTISVMEQALSIVKYWYYTHHCPGILPHNDVDPNIVPFYVPTAIKPSTTAATSVPKVPSRRHVRATTVAGVPPVRRPRRLAELLSQSRCQSHAS